MADPPDGASTVFISYCHQDKDFLVRLQAHLRPHVRAGSIPLWVDSAIRPGDQWKEEIERALKTTQVAILLVSVGFLASDFVAEEELPQLLSAAEDHGARILPVVLTPCSFRHTKLSRFQAVNDPTRPLSGLSQYEQDVIWQQVVDAVLEALEQNPLNYTSVQDLPQLGAATTLQEPTQNQDLPMIDLGIAAAREIGADQHAVSLTDLHAAYLRAHRGISKGRTLESFGATINYHTINMRSRFPEAAHKRKPASWLTRPVFKRVAYGQYMLLSPEEIALFRRLIEADDPRIYEDEYDLSEFALPTDQMAVAESPALKTNDGREQVHVQQKEYKHEAGQPWNKESLLARLAEICSPEGVQAAQRLYKFAIDRGAKVIGNKDSYASVTFHFLIRGKETSTFTLEEWKHQNRPQGNLRVNFEYLVGKGVPLQALARLAETLRTIPGVQARYVGLEEARYKKRPALPINQILTQPGAVETILGAFENLLLS